MTVEVQKYCKLAGHAMRYWSVWVNGELFVLTLYRKGAEPVATSISPSSKIESYPTNPITTNTRAEDKAVRHRFIETSRWSRSSFFPLARRVCAGTNHRKVRAEFAAKRITEAPCPQSWAFHPSQNEAAVESPSAKNKGPTSHIIERVCLA